MPTSKSRASFDHLPAPLSSFLDTTLDTLKPEAIVYAPDKNGKLQMVAVEYMVPAEAWDAENDELPQLL